MGFRTFRPHALPRSQTRYARNMSLHSQHHGQERVRGEGVILQASGLAANAVRVCLPFLPIPPYLKVTSTVSIYETHKYPLPLPLTLTFYSSSCGATLLIFPLLLILRMLDFLPISFSCMSFAVIFTDFLLPYPLSDLSFSRSSLSSSSGMYSLGILFLASLVNHLGRDCDE